MRLDLLLHLPPVWGGGGVIVAVVVVVCEVAFACVLGMLDLTNLSSSSPSAHPLSPSRCNHWVACMGAPAA